MQFLNAARRENIERRATVPDFRRASAGTIRGTAADTRGNYQYTRPGACGGPNTSLDEPAADQSSMRRFLGWNPPGHVLRSVTRSLWSLSATLAIIGPLPMTASAVDKDRKDLATDRTMSLHSRSPLRPALTSGTGGAVGISSYAIVAARRAWVLERRLGRVIVDGLGRVCLPEPSR
jgi:hypothetical protein